MNKLFRILILVICACVMSLVPIVASDTVPSLVSVAPQTSDINTLSIIAVILIMLFTMFIIIKKRFTNK